MKFVRLTAQNGCEVRLNPLFVAEIVPAGDPDFTHVRTVGSDTAYVVKEKPNQIEDAIADAIVGSIAAIEARLPEVERET